MAYEKKHKPVTRTEIIEKTEKLFRETNDPGEAMRLGQLIAKWRSLPMESDENNDTIVSTQDRAYLEKLMGGNDAGSDPLPGGN